MIDVNADHRAREALAANPFPKTPLVEIGENAILIKTGYSEALNRLLRWVPKAKFRSDQRVWTIPFAGAEAVRAVLPEIIRLAEASQDLEAAEARQRQRLNSGQQISAFEHFAEAAELLHGRDWQNIMPDALGLDAGLIGGFLADPARLAAGDEVFTKLLRLMRGKAAELITLADELEEWNLATRAKPGPKG
jgi:hypothetical protein